jgi:molecular chaperone GrpE
MEEVEQPKNQKETQADNAAKKEDLGSAESQLEVSQVEAQAKLDTLQAENEQLKVQAAEYLDSLQRERASFANYRKRIDQENLQIYDLALGDLIQAFLPVVDDLERALKHKPEIPELEPWYEGIALTLQKLQKTLESKGVEILDVKAGDEFNPAIHEAVSHEDHPNFNDGQIVEVLQNGYKIKNRIIRPALVRVAK